MTYGPFGPATGWRWGNGTATVARTYNQDGYVTNITTAGDPINFGYDNASRLTGITDTQATGNSWTIGYDSLDRVASDASSVESNGWTYDSNGNRLTATGYKAGTFTISPTSNQVTSSTGAFAYTFAYDAAGNAKSYSNMVFTYNGRGRQSAVAVSGATTNSVYSAEAHLIKRSFNSSGAILVHDLAGHILGEYSLTGGLAQETVWMGDIPVATLQPNGTAGCSDPKVCIFYVHTDQLNAPRKITNSANTLTWRWDPNAYGYGFPNQNPSSLGTFVYNLRFPGQYYIGIGFDNGFRSYDGNIGRYVESDPIGLAGGSYSTYSYASANPISVADPLGLSTKVTVRCGILPASMGGSSGGVHCEVVATCDKTGESVAFGIGGGGNGIWQRLFGGKIPPKYQNPALPQPGTGVSEYSASCGADSDCGCDTLKCFKKMQGTNTPLPDYALSQNSNTYAHSLLNRCGCSLSSRPSGAVAW